MTQTLAETDIREVASCTCLRVRKAARTLTRAYDAALAPAGLTIGQFGLLARLYGRRRAANGTPVGELAELVRFASKDARPDILNDVHRIHLIS